MTRHRKKTSSQSRFLWLAIPGLLGLLLYLAIRADDWQPGDKADLISAGKLLESKESLYNNIYIFSEDPYVSMTFGYNRHFYTESIANTKDDRELPAIYTRFMTASLLYPDTIHSILEIGSGGGRMAWYLHRFLPKAQITSVELDPAVTDFARKYFGIRDEPNFRLVNEDGRKFLAHATARYDIILIDAYRGPFVPFHLLTKEFYQLVKDRLAKGGVVAQNVDPTTMLFDSAVRTIGSVFPDLDFYAAKGNVVTIAYDGAVMSEDDLERRARERQDEFHLRYKLPDMLAARRSSGSSSAIDPGAKILTDDFAPVETLRAIEAHNRKWHEPL